MKSNRSKYISIALLVLFTYAFSIQNLSAITRNFKIELSTLFNGKYLKTIHAPAADRAAADESPCEKETEDESETQFNPVAILVNFSQDLYLLQPRQQAFVMNSDPQCRQDTQHPLYLVICTFRI